MGHFKPNLHASDTSRPIRSNPKLPSEIFREVIREVTLVPGAFDRQLGSPIDVSELLNSRKLKEKFEQSQQTAMKVEQVSRDWCASARPFKFEILSLDKDRDWCSPAKQLLRRNHGGRHVGVLVRRLELHTSRWTNKEIYAAENLLRCCTELNVLSVGSNVDGVDGRVLPILLLFPIFIKPSGSLHSLFLLSPLDSRSARWVIDNLPNLNLHALSLRLAGNIDIASAESAGDHQCPVKAAILPELDALEIFAFDPSEIMEILNDWGLPSLRRFSIREQTFIQETKFTSFLVAHGVHIRILEVDSISSLTKVVLDLCPNLVDFVTDVRFAVTNQIFAHPNIQRIGFRGFARAKEDPEVRVCTVQCFSFVFPLLLSKLGYPKLQTIRFLDFDQDGFASQGWDKSEALLWASWAKRCEETGRSLLDHGGQQIEIEVASSSTLQ